MDDIDLLPEALRSQSLSDREIVLPYQQALAALDILVAAHWALLGWEGWVKYPDGRHSFATGSAMGTVSIDQEPTEIWDNYVQRSSQFCADTMSIGQQGWNANPAYAHLPLYFCLTAIPETESSNDA